MEIRRYCPEVPLPPHGYFPGGPFPHPNLDGAGHSVGRSPDAPQPITDGNAAVHPRHRWAIDLFNHGYYWEAHEAWESLWIAAGRIGPVADFLKGLIHLAAAGVKIREGVPEGVHSHARRADELFAPFAARTFLALDLEQVRRIAGWLRDEPAIAAIQPVLTETLELKG
jgi:hypothetical protein